MAEPDEPEQTFAKVLEQEQEAINNPKSSVKTVMVKPDQISSNNSLADSEAVVLDINANVASTPKNKAPSMPVDVGYNAKGKNTNLGDPKRKVDFKQ